MLRSSRYPRTLSVLVFFLAALAAAAAPAHLILCVPSATDSAELARKLETWRKGGRITAGQLLKVARGVTSAETIPSNAALGAVAVLEFADEAALTRWQQSPEAKLAAGMTATRVDLISRLEVAGRDSRTAVFLIAEYEIMVPPARYREYVDGYVVPQMNAWKKAGLITGAFMYTARERAGAPFHAMLLLEHRDAQAFARRDDVKDESRAQLASIPSWKALSDVKATIRTEKFLSRATLAESTSPQR